MAQRKLAVFTGSLFMAGLALGLTNAYLKMPVQNPDGLNDLAESIPEEKPSNSLAVPDAPRQIAQPTPLKKSVPVDEPIIVLQLEKPENGVDVPDGSQQIAQPVPPEKSADADEPVIVLQIETPDTPNSLPEATIKEEKFASVATEDKGQPEVEPDASVPLVDMTVAGARTALRMRDYGRASKILSSPQLSQDSEAMYLLATLYRNGDGVTRNDERAFNLTQQSAQLGNVEAQFSVGRMYLSGRGVEPSGEQAQLWIAKAAEAGHSGATETLVAVMTGALKPTVPEAKQEPAPLQIKASDIASSKGSAPVIEAAARGEIRALKPMIEAGESLDVRDPEGRTPLMLAVAGNHIEAVRALLEGGSAVAATDTDGRTALFHAAKYGGSDVLDLLIKASSDVNARDNEGITATERAFLAGKCKAGSILLQHQGQVEPSSFSDTAIAATLKHCGIPEMHALEEAGIELNFSDQHDRNAIWHAANAGNTEAVKYLIESGFNPNSKDAGGLSALLTSINGAHANVALSLIDAGADTGVETTSGNTALLIAATRGLNDVTEALLKVGAEVDHRNRDGYSALMLASKYGRRDTMELLISQGADAGLRNVKRERAADIAIAAGYGELAELIQ